MLPRGFQRLLAALFVGVAGLTPPEVWAQATVGPAGVQPLKDKVLRDFNGDCLRSGCHGELNRTPWVHGPVAVGSCDVCHREVAVEGKQHQYALTRDKEQVCTYCHGPMGGGRFVHKVVTDSGCTKCHNPHGGAKRNLLVTQDTAALCGECHDPLKPMPLAADGTRLKSSVPALRQDLPLFTTLHEPVKKGECLSCHEVHRSEQPALLTLPKQDLCLACHDKMKATLAASGAIHAPVSKDCSLCHVAHGGGVKGLLPCEPTVLCLACHTQVATTVTAGFVVPGEKAKALEVPDPSRLAAQPVAVPPATVAVPEGAQRLHGAIGDARGCVLCHESHAGVEPTLVKTPLGAACYACHDKSITMLPSGRVVADVKAEMARTGSQHKPVAEGLCAKCHLGHASAYPALLAKAYPEGLYEAFDAAAYALCFECHDPRLVQEDRSVRTAFRDGERNLHYLHVHDEDSVARAEEEKSRVGKRLVEPVRKGRSCKVCHEAHAGAQAAAMRQSIPYGPGGWQLAIAFERTEDGGRCLSACHKEKRYRNTEPPAPPAEPKRAPDPAEKPDTLER